jgi:hypothetical protein
MAGVSAPAARISAGAIARGRRLRRRRRAAAVVGAAALVGVVGAGLPHVLGGESADRSREASYTDRTAAVDPAESHGEERRGWWSMPATEMTAHLTDLLPRGTRMIAARTHSEEPGDDQREWTGFLVAHLDTPASSGPGGVNLYVTPPDTPTGDPQAPGGPARPGADAPASASIRDSLRCPGDLDEHVVSCQVLRDNRGRRIGRLSRIELGDVVLLAAVMRTTDGGAVHIDASNSTDDKWGLGSRRTADQPPLTLAQLRAIVADPVWTGFVP